MAVEPDHDTASRRSARTGRARVSRRGRAGDFTATTAALEELAAAGAQVSIHITDLDRGSVVLAGDDYVPLPIAGVGVVPILVEAAVRFEAGTLDPLDLVDRSSLDRVAIAGIWRHLSVPTLPLGDLVVLAAAAGDAYAVNALLRAVGIEAVTRRLVQLGMPRSAVLDRFRDERGPDDAPHFALGTTREYATLFSDLVNGRVIDARVSAQVSEWLTLGYDLSLVGAATNLDPFAHDDDRHGLLFLNRTGRDADGVRAEAGVIAGPRAGVAYALTVCFDDLGPVHRDRAHRVFRTLGAELMEFVH